MAFRSILCAFAAVALFGAPCFASVDEETEDVVVQPTDEGTTGSADELLPNAGAVDDEVVSEPVEGAPLPEAAYSVPVPGQYPAYGAIPPISYNYYYPGYSDGTMPARLYLCPRPVPLFVGYTYITYHPLAPHEFLWPHARCYYQYHPGSGTTVTTIKYR